MSTLTGVNMNLVETTSTMYEPETTITSHYKQTPLAQLIAKRSKLELLDLEKPPNVLSKDKMVFNRRVRVFYTQNFQRS